MKLRNKDDFSADTFSIKNTPGPAAQRLPFCTTSAGHFIAGRQYFTEREGLENSHLLFFTIAGAGRLVHRGREWSLLPGTAALINCFEYQYYATASDVPWNFIWIHISGQAAAEYEERINAGTLSLVRLDDRCITGQALDSILDYLRDKDDNLADVRICRAIMEIMTELLVHTAQPAGAGSPHRRDMEAALATIRAHYPDITGIDQIAAGAHISKYYFLRLFKAYTGQGLYEYLNNYRVDAAKRLLKEDCSVCGAARAVGFSDVNCFIRYFKKVTGVTPAVYQKYVLF